MNQPSALQRTAEMMHSHRPVASRPRKDIEFPDGWIWTHLQGLCIQTHRPLLPEQHEGDLP